MTAPTLHALGPMAMISLTLFACIRFWEERPPVWRVISFPIGSILLLVVLPDFFVHDCTEGMPHAQIYIGSICFAATGICVRRMRIASPLCILILVVTFSLSNQYDNLVHSTDITGDPQSHLRMNAEIVYRVSDHILEHHKKTSQAFPPGWVRDSEELGASLEGWKPIRYEVSSFWHSWFTRLYAVREVPADLWFTGGTQQDDLRSRLELRDRTAKDFEKVKSELK